MQAPHYFNQAKDQLNKYFKGELKRFNLDLSLRGTEFQKTVWTALMDIPYGKTESYSGMAARIKRPKAVRAVGSANGKNPIPIVIPCHRVIGQNGSLTGFGGGLALKAFLLQLEGVDI